MRDQAFAEERGDAATRAVEELIGDDEVERAMLFLQRTDRTQRNDPLHAERFEAVDVRAEFSSEGEMRCPRPWRARNATSRPAKRADDVVIRRACPRAW